jgi:hypothetical protein
LVAGLSDINFIEFLGYYESIVAVTTFQTNQTRAKLKAGLSIDAEISVKIMEVNE